MASTLTPAPAASKRYEFGEPIGSGGAGTVYRARDRRTGLPVAIKVLRDSVAKNATQHQRLAQEFRAATQLEHPNIVRAIEVETDGSTSFLVYELVEGEDLGEKVRRCGPLPEDEAVRIITQVAQALHYAHLRSVVHRDVKPDNIMVLPDGRAKLTDFGLAKDYNNDLDLTRNAAGLGTPHYMAPEQFGNAKHVGPPADVYSLGATLYAAVTGVAPFHAKAPLAILANKEKAAPSARVLVPELGERVDAAIRAALAPHHRDRPQSCLEFFKLLTARTRFDGDPGSVEMKLTIPLPPPAGNERRSWVRHPLGVGMSGAVDTAAVEGCRETEELWPLVVRDVSVGGVGLLLARRFEQGTELTVEVVGGATGDRRLSVKVVRVEPDTAGHWVHGCAFSTPLSPDELGTLLQ